MTASRDRSLPAEKHCAVCGRRMEWRKKWARNWDQVKYCSQACRRRRNSGPGPALESAIVELLASRSRNATLCPSEAARQVAGRQDARGSGAGRGAGGSGAGRSGGSSSGHGASGRRWRDLVEPAREAGRRLAAREVVVFRQQGRVVDPSTAKGPVRIGRGRRWRDR